MNNGASSYRRFLDGDDNGFAEIIDGYYDGLVLYLNEYVRNFDTAEELAEDTFVKLVTKKPRFSGKSSFKTFLYAVGRNVALDYLRREKKRGTVPIDDFTETLSDDKELEQSFLREEQKIILHRSMQSMKTEYRQALWLAYFEDLSTPEIARIMKKSVNSVEHLIHRAKLSLKSEIEKEDLTL
ncbi:MAG: RNA polymerase sigma factor [Butyrivibrio sp.]|nr:RNA polymerase sigma factor [Butyrivibrio sp.]